MKYGYLSHHGIKGQKWGIRRYQNADGSLTAEGIARYGYNQISDKDKIKFAMSNSIKRNALGFRKLKQDSYEEKNEKDTTGIRKKMINLIQDLNETDNKNYDEYMKSSNSDLKNYYKKPEVIKDVFKFLEEGMVKPQMVDDPEFIDYDISDYIQINSGAAESNKTRKLRNKMENFEKEKKEIFKKYVDNLTSGADFRLDDAKHLTSYKKEINNAINEISNKNKFIKTYQSSAEDEIIDDIKAQWYKKWNYKQ